MSKKYVIDLPDDAQYILINGASENHCYTRIEQVDDLEELNSDYINEHFGELQDEAYQAGLNDAWEAARKIFGYEIDGALNIDELVEAFGYKKEDVFCTADIIRANTAEQAIAKLKAYEDKQKDDDHIKVGDEVIWKTDDITLIVTATYERGGIKWCDGVAQDGKVYSTLMENDRKTGKHYDIASILEAMRK